MSAGGGSKRGTSGPVTVCCPFVGDSIGGSHFSALLLLKNLDTSRYRPRIVIHQRGPLEAHLRATGVKFEMLPLSRFVGTDPHPLGHLQALARSAPPLIRFLKASDIGIVHAHDGRMNLTWSLPTRLTGRRYVWHQRSAYKPSRLVHVISKSANLTVCISQFVADGLPGRRRPIVIENPFETSGSPGNAARESFFTRSGANPDAKIIGLVGNLREHKRPFLFLEVAAQMIRTHNGPLAFVIFGADPGGLQPALEKRAQTLGIAGKIHFMGFAHPIGPWIAACDLLLVPAVGEAFGRTTVEAMVVGTPVVASDSGGHREIIEPGVTGILVLPDDAPAMAAAAAALLADPARYEAVTSAARQQAVERYSVDAHARAMMDLYDTLGVHR